MVALLSLPFAHSSVCHGWVHGRRGPNPHRARPGLDPAPDAQLRPPSLAFPELALNLLAGPPSPISDFAVLLLAMAPSTWPGRSSLQLELPPPMDVYSSSLSSRSSLCSPHLSPWRARPSLLAASIRVPLRALCSLAARVLLASVTCALTSHEAPMARPAPLCAAAFLYRPSVAAEPQLD
ncbi:hypothetical protein Zm00014a_031099 [Zea mays]|uniref:Uncharacterized protein n=1 Tax=Zea mays TaxID=4577 RepID=A0A3L6E1X8_MAIZE|nr:hypothetical protein Zm00014a_031099 [Zea mays]